MDTLSSCWRNMKLSWFMNLLGSCRGAYNLIAWSLTPFLNFLAGLSHLSNILLHFLRDVFPFIYLFFFSRFDELYMYCPWFFTCDIIKRLAPILNFFTIFKRLSISCPWTPQLSMFISILYILYARVTNSSTVFGSLGWYIAVPNSFIECTSQLMKFRTIALCN